MIRLLSTLICSIIALLSDLVCSGVGMDMKSFWHVLPGQAWPSHGDCFYVTRIHVSRLSRPNAIALSCCIACLVVDFICQEFGLLLALFSRPWHNFCTDILLCCWASKGSQGCSDAVELKDCCSRCLTSKARGWSLYTKLPFLQCQDMRRRACCKLTGRLIDCKDHVFQRMYDRVLDQQITIVQVAR